MVNIDFLPPCYFFFLVCIPPFYWKYLDFTIHSKISAGGEIVYYTRDYVQF